MIRLAVMGSGNGSNFQSMLDAIGSGSLDAEVACVISDKPDAFILERARRANIPALYVDPAPFRTKLDGPAEERVVGLLQEHGTEFVALAGFMRMIKQGMLAAYPHRMINIHPSLLPSFPGLEAWRQAVDVGVKVSGCTVHFIDEGMDTGPIIAQRTVPVLDGDTAETLHARIQEQEHQIYPTVLQWIAENRLRIEGRRVLGAPE